MQFLWKYIDELVGKGLEFNILMELMLYASATMVPMALPLAILLSSIMTFGNLGERYELVALKSSGISLQRIMAPIGVLTIIICILAFLFSNYALPKANLKMTALLYDVRHKRPELDIREGIFYDGIDDFSIKISSKNRETNMLYNLLIYDHRQKKGNLNVTVADSGKMVITPEKDMLIFSLYNGYSYEEVPEDGKKATERKRPHRRHYFNKQKIAMELSGYGLERSDEELFKDGYKMLNIAQLDEAVDSLKEMFEERKYAFSESLLTTNYYRKEEKNKDSIHGLDKSNLTVNFDTDSLYKSLDEKNQIKIISMASNYARSTKTYISTTKEDYENRSKWIWKHELAWHKKLTLSFACLVLFFIGAPLGAIIRKGGLGMPTVVSVLLFILYYVIDITGEKFVKEGVMEAAGGMWLSSGILLPLGFFLTYKAANDSQLFNIDAYLAFFTRIFKLGKKNRKSKMLFTEYKTSPTIDNSEFSQLLEKLRYCSISVLEIHNRPDPTENNTRKQDLHQELNDVLKKVLSEIYNRKENDFFLTAKFSQLNNLAVKVMPVENVKNIISITDELINLNAVEPQNSNENTAADK